MKLSDIAEKILLAIFRNALLLELQEATIDISSDELNINPSDFEKSWDELNKVEEVGKRVVAAGELTSEGVGEITTFVLLKGARLTDFGITYIEKSRGISGNLSAQSKLKIINCILDD